MQIYVDTADVRQTILGAHAFFDAMDVFMHHDFRSLRALTWAILWSGAAGPVCLLAPHQAELLTQLQHHFNRDYTTPDARRVVDLLEYVKNDRPRHADDYLTTMIKTAAAVQLPWRNRLAKLVRDGTLKSDTVRADYTHVIRDDLFHDLYDAFMFYRRGKENNNFADAAALVTVVQAAEAYQRGETEEVPRFFASSTLFETALQHAKARERLTFTIDGADFDALVDPSYIVAHTLFDNSGLKSDEQFADSVEDVFAALSEGPEAVDLHTMQLTNGFRDSLTRMTSPLLYRRVWIPIEQMVDSVAPEVLAIAPPPSEADIEQQVRTISAQLRRNTEDFRRLREIWIAANDAFAIFAKRHLPQHALHIEGLVRFSFPKSSLDAIEEHIAELRSRDQVIIDDVSVLTARVVKSPDSSSTEFFVVAALLWVLKLDDRLIRLLGELRDVHPSLRFLRAAAHLRSKTPSAASIASKTVDDLLTVYRVATKEQQRAAIAIGIAYLEFRLALAEHFTPTWERADDQLGMVGSAGKHHIERAIEYARLAATCMRLDDDRRAYATNQHLYYLIAEGAADNPTLQSAASRLGTFKYKAASWQYRFDDTLARYFFLRARREQEGPGKLQLLRYALDASASSLRAVPDDGDIQAFNDHLRIIVGGDVVEERPEKGHESLLN